MSEIFDASDLYQIPLPFHLHEKNTFQNFYSGSNEVAVSCLQQLTEGNFTVNLIYLWGHRFVGCTHLLKASYEAAISKNIPAVYLSCQVLQEGYQPESLSEVIGDAKIVCFDDIAAIGYSLEWQTALFNAYTRLSEESRGMVFGAHEVPRQLPFQLQDLVSRLNSGLLFQIHELNDVQKIEALRVRAYQRGFELEEPVARFLLSRLPRSARALLDALNQLDLFSSAKQHKLTMPFVKKVLKL